jgi:hypothetical protein
MSIVYPRRDKVTLPSVESWGTNNNIMRDPPKSLFTRKIDRITDTSKLNEMIDGAGDRINETILLYPRGRNPMIGGVDYGSTSNAGLSGGITTYSRSIQPKLPYRIMDGGAFRPPIMTERDLLPLSRLPYGNYSVTSKPEFKGFEKQLTCPDKIKEASKLVMRSFIRPTATYKLERPVLENFTATREDNLHALANTNIIGNEKNAENTVNTDQYTRDALSGYYTTNAGVEVGGRFALNENINHGMKDIRHTPLTSNIIGNEMNANIAHIEELERTLPRYNATTNISDNRTDVRINPKNNIELRRTTPITQALSGVGANIGTDEISSRQYNARQTLTLGGFENGGFEPTAEREEGFMGSGNDAKVALNKRVAQEYFQRYSQPQKI